MSIDSHVLVVDDDFRLRNLLCRNLETRGFRASHVGNAEEALAALDSFESAVVISDIDMPHHDGLWLLGEIRQRFPDTQVIMVTGVTEMDAAISSLRRGASDYITKPFRTDIVAAAIDRALETRRLVVENRLHKEVLERRIAEATTELRAAYRSIELTYGQTLEALSAALDVREHETSHHSHRVQVYGLALARRLGVSENDLPDLSRGALLHDLGKIGVPDHILLKPTPLDVGEWELMRRHPEIGAQILSGIEFLAPASAVVLHHHEHVDGSGYPYGLRRDDIPFHARIFSVADALDAMTSDRPYRRALGFQAAIAEIRRCSGTQFDPMVVDALVEIDPDEILSLSESPIGTPFSLDGPNADK